MIIWVIKFFDFQLKNSFMEGNNTWEKKRLQHKYFYFTLVHNELISLCFYKHAVVCISHVEVCFFEKQLPDW